MNHIDYQKHQTKEFYDKKNKEVFKIVHHSFKKLLKKANLWWKMIIQDHSQIMLISRFLHRAKGGHAYFSIQLFTQIVMLKKLVMKKNKHFHMDSDLWSPLYMNIKRHCVANDLHMICYLKELWRGISVLSVLICSWLESLYRRFSRLSRENT